MARTTSYDRHREATAERARSASRSGRDLGPIPRIANVRRRTRCRTSLRLFCETYNPAAFSLAWCSDHLTVIARIEEAALHGALFAFAMPRGSGKTALCRMAALWAISYCHCRYVFIVGANAGKGKDSLAAVKTWVRFLPDYAADFPEIAAPVQALGGIANRASGQLCMGEPTCIEWSQDRITLPTVPPPANWPRTWSKRADGKVPTSGSVISASGLTGDGIRGSVLTLTTGELLRPDLVLLDDPQTPESARSPAQNADREQLVAADLLGLAGPGKSLSAVMPCTVIQPGDMADNLLDQDKHPLWRGERTRLLRSMPADLAAWDRYFEVYRRCARKKPPDYAEANAYYKAHRAELDAGAEASWPERKLPWEVSAIQSAMHLYCRDRRAFFSEYQNDPLPLVPPAPGDVLADQIMARVNRRPRGLVPVGCTRLTATVDVQQDLLWWAVVGWADDFTGSVVDYGAWPDQRRSYFTQADARPTIAAATGIGSLEGSLWAALTALADQLLSRRWELEGGGVLTVERALVDAGWGMSSDVVKQFCRESAYASVLTPSFGRGITAGQSPIGDWPEKVGERRGREWIQPKPKSGQVRIAIYDANWWKSFLFARLAQPIGERGAIQFFGDDPEVHRMLAAHCKAEYRVKTSGRGREVEEWFLPPHRPDNHLFDCCVMASVAASMLGVALPGQQPEGRARPRRKVSYREMQRQARERARAR